MRCLILPAIIDGSMSVEQSLQERHPLRDGRPQTGGGDALGAQRAEAPQGRGEVAEPDAGARPAMMSPAAETRMGLVRDVQRAGVGKVG